MLFYYLDGEVTILDANLAVIDCGGVGFECAVSRNTQAQLQTGKRVRLYTWCSVREDAVEIFGFATRDEQRCFQQLVSVNGVGPKAALAVLSVTTPQNFRLAVLTGDEKVLTAAPGIGKKIAQRILLELKDKIAGEQTEYDVSGGAGIVMPTSGSNLEEAMAALAALGYSTSESAAALRGADTEHLQVQELIRYALRAMVQN